MTTKKKLIVLAIIIVLLNVIPALICLLADLHLLVPVAIIIAILIGIRAWRNGHKTAVLVIGVIVLLHLIGFIMNLIF